MPRLGNEIDLYLADGAASGGFDLVGCSNDLSLTLSNEFFAISDMTPDAFKLLPTFTSAVISGSAIFETVADIGKLASTQLLEWCNEKDQLDWRIITSGMDLYGECFFESFEIVGNYNQLAIVNFTLRVSGKLNITGSGAACPLCTSVVARQTLAGRGQVSWTAGTGGDTLTGFIVRVYDAGTHALVSSQQVGVVDVAAFDGLAYGNYYATVQSLCGSAFSNETNGTAFTISVNNWVIDGNGTVSSSTDIEVRFGNNGDPTNTNLLYSGTMGDGIVSGSNGLLPAVNLGLIFTIMSGETLTAATLNGVAPTTMSSSGAGWASGISGDPLVLAFTTA